MNKIALIPLLFYFLIFSQRVYAVTTSLEGFTSPISADPFTINVTIASASAGTNYLKIDLYKNSGTNYFGETFNGTGWISTGDYSQFLPITIQSGTNWSGQVQGRLGYPTLTQFNSFGQYRIRVRRYTSSGSYNSTEANNGAIDVVINMPTLLPTIIPTPIDTVTLTETPIKPTPTEQIIPLSQSYDNIYLSEVMVNPLSGEKEWVEIYNDNDFSINLINWFVDDIENGGSSPKTFSLNIEKKNYATFDLSSAIFNNSGDSVRLLDFNKNLKDSFEYGLSEQGQTFGRSSLDSDDFCIQQPSKNNSNGHCLDPSPVLLQNKIDQIYISPTPIITKTKIPISVNPINPNPIILGQDNVIPTSQTDDNSAPPDVLGLTTKISKKNYSLITLLTFLSSSYSLLTIISILFKMRLSYGKNKKLYSSSFYPS